MKKLFLLITLLTTVLFTTAQDSVSTDVDPNFHFGIKGSLGLAWLKSNTKTVESDGSILRASYGFIADFKFAKNYAFSTGVDISYKGGQLKRQVDTQQNDSTLLTQVYEQKTRLTYVEIPLTVRLKTNQIGYVKYYLQVGVAPGINIKANYDADVQQETQVNGNIVKNEKVELEDEDLSKDVNFFNMSMIIGAGIEYNLTGTTNLITGITFTNGFLDISEKKSDDAVLNNSKLNSNLISLNVGILF